MSPIKLCIEAGLRIQAGGSDSFVLIEAKLWLRAGSCIQAGVGKLPTTMQAGGQYADLCWMRMPTMYI